MVCDFPLGKLLAIYLYRFWMWTLPRFPGNLIFIKVWYILSEGLYCCPPVYLLKCQLWSRNEVCRHSELEMLWSELWWISFPNASSWCQLRLIALLDYFQTSWSLPLCDSQSSILVLMLLLSTPLEALLLC